MEFRFSPASPSTAGQLDLAPGWENGAPATVGPTGSLSSAAVSESTPPERGSAPIESPVHPNDLLATIYHCIGIDPHTMINNHLNQPRELVKGTPGTGLFA